MTKSWRSRDCSMRDTNASSMAAAWCPASTPMNSAGADLRASGGGCDLAQYGGPARAMGRFEHYDIAGTDSGEQALAGHSLYGCQHVPIFSGNQPLTDLPGGLPLD